MTQQGWTYAIRCTETGRIKIGVSHNPWERFRGLATMSPTRLEFTGILDLDEREAHRMLAGHRMHGEWFAPNDQVLAIVREFMALSAQDYAQLRVVCDLVA